MLPSRRRLSRNRAVGKPAWQGNWQDNAPDSGKRTRQTSKRRVPEQRQQRRKSRGADSIRQKPLLVRRLRHAGRPPYKQEVPGSNPSPPTIRKLRVARELGECS